jgi:hypothetical protein
MSLRWIIFFEKTGGSGRMCAKPSGLAAGSGSQATRSWADKLLKFN